MKRNVYHIVFAWALLLSFVTGQYMVYAHQHNLVKNVHASCTSVKHAWHQSVQEKCQLCDSMHHVAMDVNHDIAYQVTLTSQQRLFVSPLYSFTSISLILASGRAPPVFS
ncbi:hypothetical protein DYU05_11775 [Mucilaginibacter terrenus]|uniref:DUF2946 domain-containing protein n=1 Tax=Mucilaginibacter terrenus TaxID=2482727 RepID=A0A3E2NPA1_9SPHI|nr:hypothetical protein [Mucilaginibacter terrenus]RFZ82836.1 hypothetical protein DYU05_11775 [Mucilaginibacter terrenus]